MRIRRRFHYPFVPFHHQGIVHLNPRPALFGSHRHYRIRLFIAKIHGNDVDLHRLRQHIATLSEVIEYRLLHGILVLRRPRTGRKKR